jgi:outer membrane autotransporter protein
MPARISSLQSSIIYDRSAMKRKHIKNPNRTVGELRCILAAFIAWLLPVLVLILTIKSSQAQSATWGVAPNNEEWGDPNNWTPNTIPNSPNDTATFDVSSITGVFIQALEAPIAIEVNGVVFNAAASTFTFSVPTASTLTISGVGGITNNSGFTQKFLAESGGLIDFTNSATAGNNVMITAAGGNGTLARGGTISFHGTSTAGNAMLIADLGVAGGSGGTISFFDTSTAGNARLDARAATTGSGGIISFFNTSTAGNATLNAGAGPPTGSGGIISFFDTSTAGNATLNAFGLNQAGSAGGNISFFNNSTAGNATLSADGGSATGSTISFFNSSTAGNAKLSVNGGATGGGAISFFDNSTAGNATLRAFGGQAAVIGGTISFFNSSTAGNATLSVFGGSATSHGTISFSDSAIGGTARVEFFGNGDLDISGHGAPGVTVGSIEGNGAGAVLLGANNLTVGTNNLSTLFSGVISDLGEGGHENGSLTKIGTGTLSLTGLNDYTGPTVVDGGSLIVDGSISSGQTSVNAGGLLGGGGTIGGNVVNGGIVSPGNTLGTPLGTLRINGNYAQSSGGTLHIEIAGLGDTQHDLLSATTANLDGTLQIIRLNNFQLHPGDQITFLATDKGVNGTFATIQNDFATGTVVLGQIIFLSDSVVLEGTQGSFKELARTICNTANDIAVGAALDSAVNDPRAASAIGFLDSEPLDQLCRDFDLIAPEELTSMFSFGISMANIQTDNLERRMNDIRAGSSGFSAAGFAINTKGHDLGMGFAGPTGPEGKSGPSVMQATPENRWGVFVTGIGEFTNVDDTANAHGFDLATGGVTLGVDYRATPNFAIGLMGGYAHTNGDLVDGGNLDVDGGKIGAYATAFSGGFYVDAAVTGGFNDYDTRRTALLGTASGDTEGREFTGLISAGYDWKAGNLTVGPVVSYQYTYVEFDGFTEHGSLLPLTFDDQSADSSRTALGAKASYDWHMGHVLVKPEIRAAWQHEFGDRDYSLVSRFANGAGNSFTVNGPEIGRDSLLLGAGFAVLFNDRVSVYAYYDGELARTNYSSNNVSAGVRITF